MLIPDFHPGAACHWTHQDCKIAVCELSTFSWRSSYVTQVFRFSSNFWHKWHPFNKFKLGPFRNGNTYKEHGWLRISDYTSQRINFLPRKIFSNQEKVLNKSYLGTIVLKYVRFFLLTLEFFGYDNDQCECFKTFKGSSFSFQTKIMN